MGTGRRGHAVFGHRVWPANPHQLRAIRSAVHQWLAPLGLAEQTREDFLLAANEAASNSVEHAYPATATGVVELTFWTETSAVCLEITDHGTWQPPAAQRNGRGLGITMMQRLVEFVAIHYDTDGTTVLLRHHRPAPAWPTADGTLDSV
jgi:anti-sigma regulatory factor (Ser/Thr protein kinase)